MRKRLCFNAIVKNETANLERCLKSVLPYISCYEILDTGSTDKTPEFITDFFDVNGIPGRVAHGHFENFEQARNEALHQARTSPYAFDHILFNDADMELIVPDPAVFHDFAFDAPQYRMIQRTGTLAYWNVRMTQRFTESKYHGVTHEYFDRLDGEEEIPQTLAYFHDHASGANRPNKAKRDRDLLKADLKIHPNNERSWFYLGQSYKEMGKLEKAVDAYQKRIDLGGWDEEVFFAMLQKARCLLDMGKEEAFVTAAVSAFNFRPTRAEALHDLARFYRLKGQNAASMVFSDAGLRIGYPTTDLLFVDEGPYKWGFLEERSICGYYVPDRQGEGLAACNDLLLAKDVPAQVREQARNNMRFYHQQLPTLERWPLASPNKFQHWSAMNPSISVDPNSGLMFAVIRTVNYKIRDDGTYDMQNDHAIQTENFYVQIANDLSVVKHTESYIRLPTDWPEPMSKDVLGWEDMRLHFEPEGKAWVSATCLERNDSWRREQMHGRIGRSDLTFEAQIKDWKVMPSRQQHEKNWMPIGSTGLFMHHIGLVIQDNGQEVSGHVSNLHTDDFRGGSQLVEFDGGWLAVIHEAYAGDRGKRAYWHRFVWFDQLYALERVSAPFYINDKGIEFVAGMCLHPDGNRMVLSYGVRDAEAWLCTVPLTTIRGMLGIPEPIVLGGPAPEPVVPARGPRPFDWAQTQINRPLLSARDVNAAADLLRMNGCTLHTDHNKNWDTAIAVFTALEYTSPGDLIIDAGADKPSAFLTSLANKDYVFLYGVNTEIKERENVGGAVYEYGDITKEMDFGDGDVDFVLCQSVLEHGVDQPAFFKEMGRILKSGGHLLVSTDYWVDGVDERGQQAFGAPIKVFKRDDISAMVYRAAMYGFELTGDQSWHACCADRVVSWMNMDYTFINLLFRKA